MFLVPKKVSSKSRLFSRKLKLSNRKNLNVSFGDYVLSFSSASRLSNLQIGAIRSGLQRIFKKNASAWIKVLPHLAITKKPEEVRMGKGKGGIKYWVVGVKENTALLEIKTEVKISNALFTGLRSKISTKPKVSSKYFRWIS